MGGKGGEGKKGVKRGGGKKERGRGRGKKCMSEEKKRCFRPGSNRGPCACEAHVITTTLRKQPGSVYLNFVFYSPVLTIRVGAALLNRDS